MVAGKDLHSRGEGFFGVPAVPGFEIEISQFHQAPCRVFCRRAAGGDGALHDFGSARHVAREKLMPVPYSHVTFTLPHQLSLLALQNPRVVYGMLFQAAAETLLTLAADPRRIGAQIGFLAV